MKKVLWSLILGVCFYGQALFAESVILINDSAFQLRAVVQGADGTELGQVTVPPGNTMTWSPSFCSMSEEQMNAPRSQTPYNVFWYCPEGSSYSVCMAVPNGGAVTAQSGSGPLLCKQKKQGENQ